MPCLAYKNLTLSEEPVICKGSNNEWASIKPMTEKFLEYSEITLVHNTQYFNNTIYNDPSMVEKSAVSWSRKFDPTVPSWVHSLVEETGIADETDKFNWGFENSKSFI